MALSSIWGHERQLTVLRRSLASGHIAPGYLFSGPERVGKTLAAREFAQVLLCAKPATTDGLPDACDECDECARMKRGRHPDFGFLEPLVKVQMEDETGETVSTQVAGSMIQVAAIGELIEEAHLKPVRGGRKVFVIASAEAMNDAAANKLLKTLEEPPGNTTLVLTSAGPALLLPTIVSRCQQLRFGPVPRDVIEERLGEAFPDRGGEEVVAAAGMAGGRPGWAIRFLERPALLEARKELLDVAGRLPVAPRIEALRLGERLIDIAKAWWIGSEDSELAAQLLKENRDRVLRTMMGDVLDVLLSWFRDLAVLGGSPEATDALVNSDRVEQLSAAAQRYPRGAAQEGFAIISEIKRYLGGNVNLRLAAETLMLRLMALSSR